MSLLIRNNVYYLRRHVPTQYQSIERRKEVWISLKTDSLKEAQAKEPIVWEKMIRGWEALLQGNSADAYERFAGAKSLANNHGFDYLPAKQVAELPIFDLLKRIDVVKRGGDHLAPAILGAYEAPSLTISGALEEYLKITPDLILGKSEDQKRKWANPRKKAISNFIDVVGDIELSKLNRTHMMQFRDWWAGRIQTENMTPNSANKDFVHLVGILKKVNDLQGLGLDLPINGLKLKERPKAERLPFSDEWIKNRLMPEDALRGLNAEARAIFLGMINTGYRPSEAAGLTPERIRLNHETPHILIAPEPGRQLKNNTSRRVIPLVGISLKAFSDFPNGFPHYRERTSSLSGTLNKFLRENNLFESDNQVVYSLRHSFEDRMIRAGIDERVRRELMGHSLGRQKYGQAGGLEFIASELSKIAL
ncbi:tyrosine-type recombinase/integrase [Marivivens sp. LCG002]|uniref:DUF6538 domain-containing protein n=1 Tax=Marivivens sp. LCG002 TaxID=3051171 RepID=UPI002553E946|nr:DUF6538 domain-containing protein [Marivivens sp. LCG002]WIV52070.1 tyrosine-type recombinase/integrase [Marivivens sp. LCG002]